MATGIKKTLRANIIPLIAIMTAVTTVLTMFVKIPTPTRGYLNLSDTMIFFSAYAFGPWVGGIVGGLGPALSDLISGYPQWAIFTFVIDGLQAVIAGLIIREFKPFNIIAGSLVAGVWKVFGYFIAGGILSGFGPALGEILGNSFQMVVGLIVGLALFSAVRKAYPPLARTGTGWHRCHAAEWHAHGSRTPHRRGPRRSSGRGRTDPARSGSGTCPAPRPS